MSNGKVHFKSKLTAYSAFLAIFLIHSSHVAAQMTGTPRSTFINQFYKACYSAQIKSTKNINANMPEDLLKKYCFCLGTYVADSTNNQQSKDIDSGDIPASQLNPARLLGEKYCAKQVLG